MRDIVSHIYNSSHWKHRDSIADQKFLSSSSHAVRMMSLEGPFQIDTLTFREKENNDLDFALCDDGGDCHIDRVGNNVGDMLVGVSMRVSKED